MDQDSNKTEKELKRFTYRRKNPFSCFERMRVEGKLCDVTIQAKEERFQAHKIILAATVPYFEKIFVNGFKDDKDDVIILNNVKAKSMELLLNFAYTGEIDLDERNAGILMLEADFLGLKDVVDRCAEFLESCINLDNVLTINNAAEKLEYKALREKSSKYILQHFVSFERTEQFLHMSMDNLKAIISSDGLQIASEEQVYIATMRWLRHDVDERKAYLPILLKCIRLPYLAVEYLENDVLQNDLIDASEECKDLVNAVIYSRIVLKEQSVFNDVKARNFDVAKSKNRIVIHSRANLSLMEMYNPASDTWESFTSNKKGSMFLSSTVLNDKLYTIGGEISVPSSIDVYDPRTNSWREIGKIRTPRNFPRVVALGDYLFVCGGHDGKNYLNLVDRYCPETGEWKTMAPMNTDRYSFGAVAWQGYIYVCGGYNENSYLTSIECYDPSIDKWTIIDASMKENRYYFGMAVLNNKIYICGGKNSETAALKTVEVYDPKSKTCEYVANMNTRRRGLMVVAYQGKLWAIGGFDGMDDLSSVELYDSETNSWYYGSSLTGTRPWICGGIIPFN